MKGVAESLAGRADIVGGAVRETFVFAQLRHRERRAGRTRSPFFCRDRTREVDFILEAGGRLQPFEAKGTELASASGTARAGLRLGRSPLSRTMQLTTRAPRHQRTCSLSNS
jgi:predicted AAA+ superfamily ATPase